MVDSIGLGEVELTTTWRKTITQAMSGFGIAQEQSLLTFVQGANPGLDVDQEVPEMEVKGPMNNLVRAFSHCCAEPLRHEGLPEPPFLNPKS